MNVDELADLVIDKFKNCGGYREMSEKKMKNSIIKYLGQIYKYDLEHAVMRLEHDRLTGKEASKDEYVKEMRKAEDNLLAQTEKLAVNSKEELKFFI